MATIEEVQAEVEGLGEGLNGALAALTAIDTKLDEVKTFIAKLKAGGTVTPAQLDKLAASVASVKAQAADAKVKSEAALTEADLLDDDAVPTPTPTE